MEEEAERIYICMYMYIHDSGVRTLVAILQPGESESLYIHNHVVCTLCMYIQQYIQSKQIFYLFIVLTPRGSSAGENP